MALGSERKSLLKGKGGARRPPPGPPTAGCKPWVLCTLTVVVLTPLAVAIGLYMTSTLPWRSARAPSLLVVGGYNGTSPVSTAESLRFPGGRWSEFVAMPCPRSMLAAARLPSAHTVLVLGGEPEACADTLQWAGSEGRWVSLAESAATDAVGAQAVTALGSNASAGEEAVLLLGGRAGGTATPTADAEVFRLDVDGPNGTAVVREATLFGVPLSPMPTPRSEFGAAFAPANGATGAGAAVIAAGGVSAQGGGPVASVDVLNVATGQWSAGPPLPTALQGLVAAAVNGMFVCVGGETAGGDVVTNGWSMPSDMSAGWEPIANMTVARAFHSGVTVHDGGEGARVCVAGGVGEDGSLMASVECYDPASDAWEQKQPLAHPRAYATAVTLHA